VAWPEFADNTAQRRTTTQASESQAILAGQPGMRLVVGNRGHSTDQTL